jgi:hypothetical protein
MKFKSILMSAILAGVAVLAPSIASAEPYHHHRHQVCHYDHHHHHSCHWVY